MAGLGAGTAVALATSFPAGMALGRLLAPRLMARIPVIPTGAATTAAGALVVAGPTPPALSAAGLALAGLGVSALYPIALADLMALPGVRPTTAASLGALASGIAILVAPAALATLGRSAGLGTAFLATLIPLALIVCVRRS
jgi:hypothetical protein